MHLSRRLFLQSSAALASLSLAPALVSASGRALSPRSVTRGRTLVVIFLRGGADGLNLVVPHAEDAYYTLRKGIGIPRPGTPGGALDLDGTFGLSPRLAALKPLFDSGQAAAIHAVGYARNTRSHFEEQDTWETGAIGNTIHSDGWLNRHLATSEGHGPIRAVTIGDALPRIMQGKAPAFAVRGLEELSLPTSARPLDPSTVSAALESAYAAQDSGARADQREHARELLARTADVTLDGIRQLRSLTSSTYTPKVPYPKSDLARKLAQVARLIKADIGLEVAEVDLNGFDTHQNQGKGADGALGNLAQQLADAVAAFHADLGERTDDVLVVTLTDFGRTAFENGTGGTDHGWANCMFLVGGAVARGHAAAKARGESAPRLVQGQWPGLKPEQLHDQRDLKHTTDFRDVIGELVATHLGNAAIRDVLPSHEFRPVHAIA